MTEQWEYTPLTPEARRRWIEYQIPGWLEEGAVRSHIYESLKGTPYGIRAEDFYALWRQVEEREKTREYWEQFREEMWLPDEARSDWGYNFGANYRDRVYIDLIDEYGQPKRTSMLFDYDSPMRLENIEAQAQAIFESEYLEAGYTIAGVEWGAGYINPMGY